MKCLLIATHHKPLIGGALTVNDALLRYGGGNVELLTAYTNYIDGKDIEGWEDHDAQASYRVHRIHSLRTIKDKKSHPILFLNRVLSFFEERALRKEIYAKVMELIKQESFDVVCFSGALDSLGWLARAVKKKLGVKTVIYIHGEEIAQNAYSSRAESRRIDTVKNADMFFVVSNFTGNILHKKYNVDKSLIKLQPNGVDLQLFDSAGEVVKREDIDLPDGRFVFSCGRLVERKGFDTLIKAWPAVLSAYPDVQLCIVGEGEKEAELNILVSNLGLEESVTIKKWQPQNVLAAMYFYADLFVLANKTMPDGDTEGFGLVFLEAAAMGTTSVGGNAGGTSDAINDQKTGLLIDAEKDRNISKAIISLIDDNERRNQLANAAYKHALSQSWQVKTNEFLNSINILVRSN